MKPWLHARKSASKFGGKPEDYIEIHNWFDQTKAHLPDSRHRMILHNSFGIFLCEQQFGDIDVENPGKRLPVITNSDGKKVSVRDIGEQHVMDDLGYIPTLSDCFSHVDARADIIAGPAMSKIRAGNYVIVD